MQMSVGLSDRSRVQPAKSLRQAVPADDVDTEMIETEGAGS
jgi:hypothetical protein